VKTIRQKAAVNTKLTLRLDEDLIAAAKRHAATKGKSVSQLVEDHFALLVAIGGTSVGQPAPAGEA
jgi:predicted HicB family RNase H-like nuclease